MRKREKYIKRYFYLDKNIKKTYIILVIKIIILVLKGKVRVSKKYLTNFLIIGNNKNVFYFTNLQTYKPTNLQTYKPIFYSFYCLGKFISTFYLTAFYKITIHYFIISNFSFNSKFYYSVEQRILLQRYIEFKLKLLIFLSGFL